MEIGAMATTATTGKRILVVDDELATLAFVQWVLEDSGYAVSVARNGAEALALLDGLGPHQPDVILLDLVMPVCDGWQFAARYRERPVIHAPIIVISAAQDPGMWAQQIAAEDVLPKPLDVDELLAHVHRFAFHVVV
jgi:two-component system, chemotaxis family, chemotaxis protein CheY